MDQFMPYAASTILAIEPATERNFGASWINNANVLCEGFCSATVAQVFCNKMRVVSVSFEVDRTTWRCYGLIFLNAVRVFSGYDYKRSNYIL